MNLLFVFLANWLESKNGYYLCGNNTGSRYEIRQELNFYFYKTVVFFKYLSLF